MNIGKESLYVFVITRHLLQSCLQLITGQETYATHLLCCADYKDSLVPSVPFPLWGHSHGRQLCQMTGFFLQRSVKATFHSPGVPHLCFSEEKPFDLPFRWPSSSSGLASVWTWDRGSSGHAAGERPNGEGGKPLVLQLYGVWFPQSARSKDTQIEVIQL